MHANGLRRDEPGREVGPCPVGVLGLPFALALPQHPYDDAARSPIFLKVEQQLGKLPAARLHPEVPDPSCALEVRQH
jgi:hypothetical protein